MTDVADAIDARAVATVPTARRPIGCRLFPPPLDLFARTP